MPKTMFTDCKKCQVRFEWEIETENDPVCQRCKDITGKDVRKILSMLSGMNVPGQKPFIHLLTILVERIEKLESQDGLTIDKLEQAKKGLFSR